MSHRTLKIAGSLVVVLAAAYAGASWYAGHLARQAIVSWIGQANRNIADQWNAATPPPELQISSYEQRIFGSRVRYALIWHDKEGAVHRLGLQDALQHGPWPWAVLRTGDWLPIAAYSRVTPEQGGGWKVWQDALPQGTSPWVARSRITFAGEVSSVVQFAPVRNDEVRFGGATVQIHYDPASLETRLMARMGDLTLMDAAAGSQVEFGGLEVQVQGRSGQDVRQSRQEVRLDRLEFQSPQGAPLILRQQVMVVDTAQTGSLMDGRADYRAARLQLGTRNLGDLQMVLAVRNLDTLAMQGLAEVLAKLRDAHPDGDDLSAAEAQQVHDALLPVFAAAPQFTLNALRWSNGKGTTKLQAHADFRPVPDGTPAALADTVGSSIRELALQLQLSKPMLLEVLRQVQSGSGDDAAMGMALVSMIFDRYAGNLQRAGLVTTPAEGLVQADLSYADGFVTVNGTKMPLADFRARLDALQGQPF